MLLANLAKSDSIFRLLTLKRSLPPASLTTSPLAIDQLMDCFVKENYNKHADYDYLAYLFADLAKVAPVFVSRHLQADLPTVP